MFSLLTVAWVIALSLKLLGIINTSVGFADLAGVDWVAGVVGLWVNAGFAGGIGLDDAEIAGLERVDEEVNMETPTLSRP